MSTTGPTVAHCGCFIRCLFVGKETHCRPYPTDRAIFRISRLVVARFSLNLGGTNLADNAIIAGEQGRGMKTLRSVCYVCNLRRSSG